MTELVTTDVRVRWGMPCLRTTGTSVAFVVALRRQGLTTEAILERCPELDAADLDAACAWYERWGEPGLWPRPPDPAPDHPRIAVDRDVQGGYPVVAGTRVTVDAVVGMWEDGCAIDEILEEFPDLIDEDVYAALAYDVAARPGPTGGSAHREGGGA